jgi:hypothetical protein
MSKPRAPFPRWTSEERQVIDRFAHAVAESRYGTVREAVPVCQRELSRVAPAIGRTDLAVAWKLLCRAYDFGLRRRRRPRSAQESRLLDRCVSALVRGACPNAMAAMRRYQRACDRAGIAAGPDNGIYRRILTLARAKGYESSRSRRPLSPEELRIVDRFSLALARDEYRYGRSAVADCLRALADAGCDGHRSPRMVARRITAGARKIGWVCRRGQWNDRDLRTIGRFARALAAGRYPTIAAASRACRASIERAGRLKPEYVRSLVWRLREAALAIRGRQFRPQWSRDELHIVDRFARALIRGEYARPGVARADCRRELDLAGFTGHRGEKALETKLRLRVCDIRRHNAWIRQHTRALHGGTRGNGR